MNEQYRELATMLHRIRARWRASVALRAWTRAAAVTASLLAGALIVDRVFEPDAWGFIALWGAALLGSIGCGIRLLAPLRTCPGDHQVARYIEERCPELEDTLATAVAQAQGAAGTPMGAAVAADAVRRVRALDVNRVIGDDLLRRAGVLAAAATVALLVVGILSAHPVSRAAHAFTAYAFPHSLSLQVSPGDVKVRAGSSLRIVARLPGASDVIVPTLRVQDDAGWRTVAMESAGDGFAASFDDLQAGFQYEVTAAGSASSEYRVIVLHPPRVERIDVRYEYPAGFHMEPRLEEDGGDIYGPEGTRVHLAIRTDKPVGEAALTLDDGRTLRLARDENGDLLTGALTIAADGSYRVALTDRDGLENTGDTQYFIRTLQDSPPDVHIIRPAGDRPVTPIEEVPIEAKADDDYGIAAFDLVVSVRGGAERAVPFRRPASPKSSGEGGAGSGRTRAETVIGHSIIYLEDLDVRPGDFVTFYARARDISRGKRSSESKSDMFFLEVKPFEEEFVSAQSRGSGSGPQGPDGSLEALIAAEKDVITATWRLDRRNREAGTKSQDDIRSVARAQAEVRRRAAGASAQNQRTDDVRRRLGAQPGPAASEPADTPLVKAADAMEQARAQLEALSTAKALPHEMTALNELLRAQAEIRRREVQRQDASNSNGGGGTNRQGQDLSSLFDRELARQQTNYETPTTAETREQKPQSGDDALEKIRDLARRQEALNREQQNLAKNRESLSEEEMRRRLERLTREQSDLRQQAENLSQQLQRNEAQGQDARGGGGGKESQNQKEGRGLAGRALQQASEEMKNAAGGLRRQDQSQASASGQRALDRLREGERTAAAGPRQNGRAGAAGFDDQRRQIGELQLESRQLADAQRRLGREGQQGTPERPSNDADRRRAGEQARLADRMQRLEESVKQLADDRPGGKPEPRGSAGDQAQRQATLAEAARDLARQKLSERMRNAAEAFRETGRNAAEAFRETGRNAAEAFRETGRNAAEAFRETGRNAVKGDTAQRRSGGPADKEEAQEIARALDRLGDRLGASAGESPADRQAADQMARARDLREQLESVDRELSELQRSSSGRGQPEGRPVGTSGQPEGRATGTSGQSTGRGTGQTDASSGAWERARDVIEQLRQQAKIGDGAREERRSGVPADRDLDEFNPGLSAPGTEAFKQDFAKWEQLKAHLSAALERLETNAAARLRDRQGNDRLNAGGAQAVPEQYRGLVDQYYRALATPPTTAPVPDDRKERRSGVPVDRARTK